MRKIFLSLLFLAYTITANAALTKSVATLDTFTSIPQNTLVVGATADVSGNYQTVLHLDAILTSATATTNGLHIVVQGSSTTSGDNNWGNIAEWSALSGITAVTTNYIGNTSAGNSTLAITSTNAFTQPGYALYIKDATIENSEIKFQKSFTASTTIVVDTLTVNNHALNTALWNKVSTQTVNIPDSVNRVRVIWDNTADTAGSSVDVRSNVSKITGI